MKVASPDETGAPLKIGVDFGATSLQPDDDYPDFVAPLAEAVPDGARAREFDCIVERVVSKPDIHESSFDIVLPADDNGGLVSCTATIRWASSVPIISLQRVRSPRVGTIECAEVILHHGLFAGMWVCAGVRGHVYGVAEPEHKSDEHVACYVNERTGAALREWWTGNGWTEDSEQAWWYEHEPDPPRETADEGAHAVYDPRGVIESD